MTMTDNRPEGDLTAATISPIDDTTPDVATPPVDAHTPVAPGPAGAITTCLPIAAAGNQAEVRTLQTWLSEDNGPHTVMLPEYGYAALVLGASASDPGQILVHNGVHVLTLPANAITTADDGQQDRTGLRGAALTTLARLHEQQQRDAQTLHAERKGHTRTLEEIRDYAIERREAGDICESGLNDFLEHFGLGRYPRQIRVTFVITGSYLVEGPDEYSARYDGRRSLRVDLSDVDDVIDDTESISVDITSSEIENP